MHISTRDADTTCAATASRRHDTLAVERIRPGSAERVCFAHCTGARSSNVSCSPPALAPRRGACSLQEKRAPGARGSRTLDCDRGGRASPPESGQREARRRSGEQAPTYTFASRAPSYRTARSPGLAPRSTPSSPSPPRPCRPSTRTSTPTSRTRIHSTSSTSHVGGQARDVDASPGTSVCSTGGAHA